MQTDRARRTDRRYVELRSADGRHVYTRLPVFWSGLGARMWVEGHAHLFDVGGVSAHDTEDITHGIQITRLW